MIDLIGGILTTGEFSGAIQGVEVIGPAPVSLSEADTVRLTIAFDPGRCIPDMMEHRHDCVVVTLHGDTLLFSGGFIAYDPRDPFADKMVGVFEFNRIKWGSAS